MSNYAKHFNVRQTPQTEQIPGRNQVKNNAGGFVFEIDMWQRLERWLVLGCEGGTYYASERKLTQENAKSVIDCIKADGLETVRRIVDVSTKGRAPKNDAAIFALALCGAFGDMSCKQAVITAVPKVCRIGTHIFQFAEASNALRGWGRTLRKAVASFYTSQDAKDLAFGVAKYQQRNGWSHRDLLRLSHPIFAGDDVRNDVAYWATKGWDGVGQEPHPVEALQPIWAFEAAKKATTEQEICRLIRQFRLPRECVPTNWLNSVAVWEALLEEMPITAIIRNLGKMTSIGLLAPLSSAAKTVVSKLTDAQRLIKGRIHPFSLLVALKTYAQGHGEKGKLSWQPVQSVVTALDDGFYTAFGAVRPTNKRWLLALDVSGSMCGAQISGLPLSAREASAAMALVTAGVEREHHFVGFTAGSGIGLRGRQTDGVSDLAINPRQRLDDVCRYVASLPFGATDCSLPMKNALARKLEVDAFVIYTDNETYGGQQHVCQSLREYRERMGIPAKLIVCGLTATGFSIADPEDGGMMDVTGFDTAVPSVMNDFVGFSSEKDI